MWQAINQQISEVIGQEFIPQERQRLDGGDIHQCFRVSDGILTFFIKTNDKEFLPMLVAESDGLEALAKADIVTVPNVICLGTTKSHCYLVLEYFPLSPIDHATSYTLGRELAELHRWGEQKEYGFDLDNYIGCSVQPNGWHKKWSRFFAEQRIGWQLQLLKEKGIVFTDVDEFVEMICMRLSGHNPKPSLLHGDLWASNVARIGQGVIVYDPACYWGDRECDVAMCNLPDDLYQEFYRGYNEVYPLEEGYALRAEIYNLYHVLNLCNCLGGHYIEQAQQQITRLLAE